VQNQKQHSSIVDFLSSLIITHALTRQWKGYDSSSFVIWKKRKIRIYKDYGDDDGDDDGGGSNGGDGDLIRLAAYKRTRGREGKAIGGGRQWAPQT